MSQLHKALEFLRPTSWADVPVDDLTTYLQNAFAQAELIVNSVPPPPHSRDFDSSAYRLRSHSNSASKALDTISSYIPPPTRDRDIEELSKGWGKPVKIGEKDNPLGIQVHKMAGHDRHGAWFARRSVHEGLGFTKWKRAMQREFPESLAVQTGPGAGSIRGIGGDRKLERHDAAGLGRAEVYELSAKFPAPTAPRDFVTLLLTSDSALSDKSSTTAADGQKIIPRHWMVVSIPCEHADAPIRQGLVRGTYESVELIRELPVTSPKSHSTPNLLAARRPDVAGRPRSSTSNDPLKHDPAPEDPEVNPVEWIMVTRSDPGGGIPRFLVDRGTPPSIASDAVKFLDWACARDDPNSDSDIGRGEPEEIQDGRRSSYSSMNSRLVAGVERRSSHSSETLDEDRRALSASTSSQQQRRGLVGQLGSALGQYAPDIVQQQLPGVFGENAKADEASDSESTVTSSIDSFASAEPYYTAETHGGTHTGVQHSTDARAGLGRTTSSDNSNMSDTALAAHPTGSKSSLDLADKEMAKIDAKKRQLEMKFVVSKEKWAKEEKKAHSRTAEEAEKQRARHRREMQKLQDRHDKDLRKLEDRAHKEARKAEARRRKQLEKDASLRTQRERDEYKQRAETLENENDILRTQLGELQRENTKLAAKIGQTQDGQELLKQVRDELRNELTSSKRKSHESDSGRDL